MTEKEELEREKNVFSYVGNKNNPPDLILANGDAIEVKKIESRSNSLQLNSSPPKSKLFNTDSRLTKACVECEEWNMRDIVYAIGYVPKNSRELRSLWMVYGDCYSADRDVYKKAENKVKNAIGNLNGLDVAPETNELSRINKVDPLNITYLRVRGMWVISNPNKVFAYLYEDDKNALFQMVCLIQSGKYKSFPQQDIQALESAQGVKIKDVDIRDPNNPANLLESKLIIYKMVA